MAQGDPEFWRLETGDTRAFASREIGGGVIGFARARSNYPMGLMDPNPPEESYFFSYQRRRVFADLFLDERNLPVLGRSDGRITIHDLRQIWRADFSSPFDTIGFHVPIATFKTVSAELSRHFDGELSAKRAHCIEDPVIRGLAEALTPVFERQAPPSHLFLDHIGWALAIHIASTYGGALMSSQAPNRLTPMQESRAKEMIDAGLGDTVRLADLAAECGLSSGYFSRAFRASTGVAPYRWLQLRRVEKSKHLLQNTRLPLAEVALSCGFCDQSHFSRVFTALVGVTPGKWRAGKRES